VSATAGETLVSSTQVVNVGVELRRELERVAREEGRDVTSLARAVLRDYLRGRRATRTKEE
jgi:hypothetical protein